MTATLTSPAEALLTALESEDAAEAVCREFAVQYPIASATFGVRHCETGRLPWSKVAALFERSLRAGVETVRS